MNLAAGALKRNSVWQTAKEIPVSTRHSSNPLGRPKLAGRAPPAATIRRTRCIKPEDVLGYFKDAWPERWDKFARPTRATRRRTGCPKAGGELDREHLDVLRHGFKLRRLKVEL